MVDVVDTQIINILKKNAKTSNVEIARQLNLTEGAIRRRILNLEKTGTIKKYTIEVAAHDQIFAVVMVKSRDETKKMMASIHDLGICYDSYEISGEFDGCVILDGSNIEEIDEKIDKLRKLPSVSDTKTFVSFKHW